MYRQIVPLRPVRRNARGVVRGRRAANQINQDRNANAIIGNAADDPLVSRHFYDEILRNESSSHSRTCDLPSHKSFMQSLYNQASSSDITIVFKNDTFQKELKLHKIFLQQSAYFTAIFDHSWKESGQNKIEITLSDENVSEQSLEIVFRSLYTGSLALENTEDDLIGVMATARFFNLDEISDQITKMMVQEMSMENCIDFYYSFASYGYPEEENAVFRWILRNFSYWYQNQHDDFCSNILNHMEAQLLEKLMTHDDFIVKDESTLYKILKKWVVDKMKMKEGYDFFTMWSRTQPFLETENGKEFERIFSLLKLNHLVMSAASVKVLQDDNFFPVSQIHRAVAENYTKLAKISKIIPAKNLELFNTEGLRIAIFNSNITSAFEDKFVDFFGIHLKFSWASDWLTVQRNRRDKENFFYHGKVAIRFKIFLYTKGNFQSDESNCHWKVIELTIQENELVNLMKLKLDALPGFPKVLSGINASYLTIPAFPNVIGIEMFFRTVKE